MMITDVNIYSESIPTGIIIAGFAGSLMSGFVGATGTAGLAYIGGETLTSGLIGAGCAAGATFGGIGGITGAVVHSTYQS